MITVSIICTILYEISIILLNKFIKKDFKYYFNYFILFYFNKQIKNLNIYWIFVKFIYQIETCIIDTSMYFILKLKF